MKEHMAIHVQVSGNVIRDYEPDACGHFNLFAANPAARVWPQRLHVTGANGTSYIVTVDVQEAFGA